MTASTLELPPPPPGKTGWPWTGDNEGGADGAPVSREGAEGGPGDVPKISIVIPSFNQAPYLEETLRSILLQGYPRLELIVQDGGSRDGSLEILERYSPWLAHWQSAADGGQSDAINQGFQRATGDLITFFSSDDLYLPGAFRDAAKRWRQATGSGAVVGAFELMDPDSRVISEPVPPRLPEPAPLDLALTPPGAWRLHQVATFYSCEALDAVGRCVREELRYTMDRDLLFRICRRYPIVLSERAYARFRRHPTSKSEAEILPFCREMAQLHLRDAGANEAPALERRRRRFVRFWHARGYLKTARAARRPLAAAKALLQALALQPRLLLRRSYGRFWLEAFFPKRPVARDVRS